MFSSDYFEPHINSPKNVSIIINRPVHVNSTVSSIKFFGNTTTMNNPTDFDNNPPLSAIVQLDKTIPELKPVNVNTTNPSTKMSDSTWTEINQCYKYYKTKVVQAARQQKIFTIYGGYRSIRNALLKRGWLEKPHEYTTFNIISNENQRIKPNIVIKSYPNFVWQPKRMVVELGHNFPYINRIRRSAALDFTTKIGLIGCIENAHWGVIDGLSELHTPRYHELEFREGRMKFLRDYQLTYCISLLKFVNDEGYDEENLFDEYGIISMDIIKNSIQTVRDEIKNYQNQSNTNIVSPMKNIYTIDWNRFYREVDSIMNRMEKFKTTGSTVNKICINECRSVLEDVKKCWPKMYAEGFENLWILKPGYSSQGHGIVIKKNLNEILNFIHNQKRKYIVQKYIERPYLIYKTKFDIRQYMMVMITSSKVNIWMYKDCYLRFSTQEYRLNELGQAVHITNNTVQKRYRNGQRSDKLPEHNMWTLEQFQKYLIENNQKNAWLQQIYPGMKKNITAVVLASLPETLIEPNRFELYGCDFIIMENCEPVLIEINATPDMSGTTVVTKQICPAVLEDVVKVVVDLSKNSKAPTGRFELIYSIDYTKKPLNVKDMTIYGESVKSGEFIKKKPITIKPNKKVRILPIHTTKASVLPIQNTKSSVLPIQNTKSNVLPIKNTKVEPKKPLPTVVSVPPKPKPEIVKRNPNTLKAKQEIINNNIEMEMNIKKEFKNDLLDKDIIDHVNIKKMLSFLTKKMLKKEIALIGKNIKKDDSKTTDELQSYADAIYKKIMGIL